MSQAQKTAKTVEDVLSWVETRPHHKAAWIKDMTVLRLSGPGYVLLIPDQVQALTRGLIEPGKQFDSRMFRANKAGRRRLRNAGATP